MHSLIIKSRSSNFTEYKKVKRSLSEKIIESKISKKTKNEINESMIKKQNINLKEYKIIKYIGKGAYGIVYLVEKDKKKFAMKVISKNFLSKYNKINEALIEKIILSKINHQSIIKLVSSFQTKTKLFYILEFCPNQDLDFVLNKLNILPKNLAKQYSAEIINVLDYLHNKLKISHNDLKPSNIMLDKNYHLKLIDFSNVKILNKKFDLNSNKFIDCNNYIEKDIFGTPEYISPEMINQTIFDYRTNDIWAFGIILYYFYHGKTPFEGENDFEIYDNIKKGEYEINQNLDDDVKDLIKHILINVNERFNINDIKKHNYFKDVNWDNLLNEKINFPVEIYDENYGLSNQDSNDKYWDNFCDFVNNNNNENKASNINNIEFLVVNINDNGILNFIDNYFYNKENNKNIENNNLKEIEYINEKKNLIFEGIFTQIGINDHEVELKLYKNKLEVWFNNILLNSIFLKDIYIKRENKNIIIINKKYYKSTNTHITRFLNILKIIEYSYLP